MVSQLLPMGERKPDGWTLVLLLSHRVSCQDIQREIFKWKILKARWLHQAEGSGGFLGSFRSVAQTGHKAHPPGTGFLGVLCSRRCAPAVRFLSLIMSVSVYISVSPQTLPILLSP